MIFTCFSKGREGFVQVFRGFLIKCLKRSDGLWDIIAAIKLVKKSGLIADVI